MTPKTKHANARKTRNKTRTFFFEINDLATKHAKHAIATFRNPISKKRKKPYSVFCVLCS